MEIARTSQEETEKETEIAPIYDVNNVPLNYIVVIDSGSKGTRAFIYGWKTPGSIEDGVRILYEEHWNKKVQPSIDNLVLNYWNDNGNLELYFDHLMYNIYKIIPREQHFRTPIFFHGTAGLRILKPKLQNKVIDKICTYLQSETDFFLPDCQSHVNIISGETEALYSWVTVNYLKLQVATEKVKSFGVFALGGGSAQIAFEPSTINVKDQIQNKLLYNLNNLPLSAESTKADHQLYLDSFVKLGFNHFHQAYLKMLVELNNYQADFHDPCLPDLFTKKIIIDKSKYTLQGTGDFSKCQSLINQLFSRNINNKSNKVLKDHAPPLSFNDIGSINYIAVTGYWDTVSKLLDLKDTSVKYNYDSLLHETKKVCSMDIQELLSSKYSSLAEKEFINLCFKSNYILEIVENGLNKESTEIKNLIVNDRMGSDNTKFSWTLGKAYLYAVDEFNRLHNLPRTSFSKNILPTLFQYGSEQENVDARPKFELFDTYEDYYLNFNDNNEDEDNGIADNYINDDRAEDSDWSSWWSGGHYFNSTVSIDYDDGTVYDDEMDDSETIKPNNLSSSNKLFSVFLIVVLLLFVFKKPVQKVLLYIIKLIKFKIGKVRARNKRYHYLNNDADFDDEYNIEGNIIGDNVKNKYNKKYTNIHDVETIPYYSNDININDNNNNDNTNNNNNNNNKNNNKNNSLSNSDGIDDMHLDFTNITRRDIELKTFDKNDDGINTSKDEEDNNDSNSNDNNDDENGIDSEVEFSDLDDGWDSDGIERAV